MYYSSGSYHGALDYGVSAGTPVYAAATGVVIKTANLTSSYGTYVVIQHANGLQTWYAHGTSGSITVSEGQTVSKGQQIMLSGNTGHSTGPHLHFEVRVSPYNYSNCRVDPRNYM
jgi:murein DD-endopeptidase MepM/ murein hydrolase activator NlpD